MSSADFQQIAVFEPDLRALGSHHFEYVQLLRSAAGRAGVAMCVFGHHAATPEVQRLTGAEPLFADATGWQARLASGWPWRLAPIQARSWLTNLLRNRRTARELAPVFRALAWERQLVLVPNCHQDIVAALGRCLRAPLRRHPTARAVLVFPFVPGRHLFLHAFRAVRPLVQAGRVALATDSQPLAELYERLTALRFTVLPMPYGAGAESSEPPSPGPVLPASGGAARFLVCGGYRMEKGIDLLADLIASQEAAITAGKMSFTLQGFANDTLPDPAAAHHFARIKASAARCPPGGITVIESELSSAEYHALFARCDAAILPYRSGPYGIRTSGVLTECLARAKPVITTADTWLGQQVQARGSGLVFPDGDGAALTKATRQLASELPRFTAEAQARQPAWLAFHNPDNYLRVLLSLANGERT